MSGQRLQVDWPSCDGRGLCHELLPEIVDLDPWGFPLIKGTVPPELVKTARAAMNACPRNALRLRTN